MSGNILIGKKNSLTLRTLGSPSLCSMQFFCGQCEDFQKLSYGSETLHITSEVFGKILKGDFADMWAMSTYADGGLSECVKRVREQGPPSAWAGAVSF